MKQLCVTSSYNHDTWYDSETVGKTEKCFHRIVIDF